MKKAEKYGDFPLDDALLGEEIAELRAETSLMDNREIERPQLSGDTVDVESEDVF